MPSIETTPFYQGEPEPAAVSLAYLLDPQHGGLPGLPRLPIRLSDTFADRPWPEHDLGERIVDGQYIPHLPVPEHSEIPPLEIVQDSRIAMDGITKRLVGYKLELFNLMLLSRDWRIRANEAVALGFAKRLENVSERPKHLKVACWRLRNIFPYSMFEERGEREHVFRLRPDMPIMDRRAVPAN